ncbi:MAG: hypothetical protein WCF96_07585 [Eubacteriales bacterium]
MKKFISITVALLLFTSGFAFSFATDTTTSQKITFDQIEATMLLSSSDMTLAKNTLDKADYDYRQVLKNIKDLEAQYNAIDLSQPGSWSTSSSLSSQLTTLRSTRDTLKSSLDTAKIKYDKQVQTNVSISQQQYIACLSANNNLIIAKNNLDSSEKSLLTLTNRLKMGFVSQNQYKIFYYQVVDARSSYIQQVTQSQILIEKLRNLLGISPLVNLEISEIPSFDFDVIDKLVYTDDLAKVMENSVSIRSAAINLDSIKKTSSSSYDPSKYKYSVIDAEILLSQTKTSVQEGFKDQYTALINSYSALKIQLRSLGDKRVGLTNAEARYKFGLVSKKVVSDLQTEIANLELTLINNQDSLYLSYQQYEASKLGY